MGEGETMTVQANGDYVWSGTDDQISGRGQRVFAIPPERPAGVHAEQLLDRCSSSRQREGMAKAFFNTLTVVIPATIIPILIAALCGLCAGVDGFSRSRAVDRGGGGVLLVVPFATCAHPAFCRCTTTYGIGKGYLSAPGWPNTGVRTAARHLSVAQLHGRFLRREIIECAKVYGATDFQIFVKIILPAQFPGAGQFRHLSSFSGQWNDLLVADGVRLIDSSGETTVMTRQIVRADGDGKSVATGKSLRPRPSSRSRCPLVVFFHHATIPCPRPASRVGQVRQERDLHMNLMQDMAREEIVAPTCDWWRGAVIYQ